MRACSGTVANMSKDQESGAYRLWLSEGRLGQPNGIPPSSKARAESEFSVGTTAPNVVYLDHNCRTMGMFGFCIIKI